MIRSLIVMSVIAVTDMQSDTTINSETNLLAPLIPVLRTVDFYDGPEYISSAPTTPTTNKKPTLQQIMYYNYYAASSYCPYELKKLSCGYCQKFKKDVSTYTVLTNNDHNTLALITVSRTRKEIVVTYRGTYNIWNIILDSLLIDAGKDKIKMHRGFVIATMSLYYDVVNNVGRLRQMYPDYKIVIVGHSLGGAMTRLTQYFLHSLNQFPNAKYEVYTYGEPRVGNKAFADFINRLTDTTSRATARGDIIPHVPPTSVLGTKLIIADYYVHPQTEFYIDGDDAQRFCDDTKYEDPKCSNSLGPAYSVINHVTYFDAKYYICFAKNPIAVTSLPFGIFEPTKIIPPLPKLVSNFLASVTANYLFPVVSPFLGRQ